MNYDLINPLVAQNIDFKTPEPGEVILKLVLLAKERNIAYTPTIDSQQQLLAFCNRKGLAPPIQIMAVPTYVPMPAPLDATQLHVTVVNVDALPSGYPTNFNNPPNGGFGGEVPPPQHFQPQQYQQPQVHYSIPPVQPPQAPLYPQ